MDPENPVVRLCTLGMQAETEGRADEARELFHRAWRSASDDYEACVAAHYARHQPDPEQTLRWNEECLRRANLVGDERVAGFYPSLHMNLARAHSELGRRDAAREQFALAAEQLDHVPPGPYADWMRLAAAEGLRQIRRHCSSPGHRGPDGTGRPTPRARPCTAARPTAARAPGRSRY